MVTAKDDSFIPENGLEHSDLDECEDFAILGDPESVPDVGTASTFIIY
jgi:hypothetical protein